MLEYISRTQDNEKARSSALYNLALVQKQTAEYDKALKNAKQAYLLNPKNDDCLKIIKELN